MALARKAPGRRPGHDAAAGRGDRLGVMAEQLSGGNVALALLANTLATVGGLCADRGLRPVERCALQPGRERGDGLARRCPWSALLPTWRCSSAAPCSAWPRMACLTCRYGSCLTALRSSPACGWPRAWPPSGWCSDPARPGRPRAGHGGGLHRRRVLVHRVHLVCQPGRRWGACSATAFAGIAPASAPAFVVAQLVGAALAVLLWHPG